MLFSSKDLRKLIIPLMFEQLLAVLVGLVDTLMVSQSGEAAVAGVALVDNINRLIIQVMAALATGGAVVCSQYIGKGGDRQAHQVCGCGRKDRGSGALLSRPDGFPYFGHGRYPFPDREGVQRHR